MKVALVDPGAFTLPYDTALCSALRRSGVDARLVTSVEASPGFEEGDPQWLVRLFYRRATQIKARHVVGYRYAKGIEHAADMFQLRQFLKSWSPDVIHFQWLVLPVLDMASLRGLRRISPLVLTIHDTQPYNGRPSSIVQVLGVKWAIRQFDQIIVHASVSKERVIQGFGVEPSGITVVPHGALTRYRRSGSQPDRPAAEPMDKYRLLFFGTIKPYKGLDVLLRALARLPSWLADRVSLDIVGIPKMDIRPLQALATSLGIADRVAWDLRYVPESEVADVFRRASLVVLPYRAIDQSGVLMLALAMGLPVVASNVGGIGEVVTDGIHGRLVPPNDAQALTKALSETLADPRLLVRMGREAYALSESYGWEAIARSTASVYERVGAVRPRKSGK